MEVNKNQEVVEETVEETVEAEAQAEEVTDSLFRFTITTKDGSQDSITTGIKSR